MSKKKVVGVLAAVAGVATATAIAAKKAVEDPEVKSKFDKCKDELKESGKEVKKKAAAACEKVKTEVKQATDTIKESVEDAKEGSSIRFKEAKDISIEKLYHMYREMEPTKEWRDAYMELSSEVEKAVYDLIKSKELSTDIELVAAAKILGEVNTYNKYINVNDSIVPPDLSKIDFSYENPFTPYQWTNPDKAANTSEETTDTPAEEPADEPEETSEEAAEELKEPEEAEERVFSAENFKEEK